MIIKELREMTVDELNARKRELRQETLHLRIQQQSGQLENPSRLKHQRREVARIETIVSERRLGAPVGVSASKKKAAPKAKAEIKATKPADKKAPAKKAPAKKAAKKAAE